MHMQVTLNVGHLDQSFLFPRFRSFDLAPIFTQFRGDPGESHRRIDLFFCRSRDVLVTAKQTIFVQFQAPLDRPAADDNVMFFRASKILHSRPVRLGRNHSQVEFDSGVQADPLFCLAACQHLFDQRIGGESIHGSGGVIRYGEHIEITTRLLAAPAGTGNGNLADGGELLQVRDDRLGRFAGDADEEPLSRFHRVGNPFEDGLFGLFAEPLEFRDFSRFASLFQLRQRLDPEFSKEDGHLLGSQSRNAQHLDHAMGNLLSQFFELRNLPCFHGHFDLTGQIFTNPVECFEAATGGCQQVGDRDRQSLEGSSPIPVGTNSKRIGPLNFEQVGNFIE